MKVSVIVPAYNAAPFLEEAVESVFATRYPELELLIIEDGSQDDTLSVARRLRAGRPECVRLLHHRGGKNRGAGASRNVGIRVASGDVVSFLDADDWYLPNRFERSIPLLDANPDVDGIYESALVVSTGTGRNEEPDETSNEGVITELDRGKEGTFMARILTSGWHTNSITIRQEFLRNVGEFNEALRLSQDSELWLRMALVGRLMRGDVEKSVPVSVYRRHHENRFLNEMGLERQLNTIRVLSSVARWARMRRVDTEKVGFVTRRLTRIAYGYSDNWIASGRLLYAKYVLLALGMQYRPVWRQRRFWGNLCKVLHSSR